MNQQQASKLNVEEAFEKATKSASKMRKLILKGRSLNDEDLSAELTRFIEKSIELYGANINIAYNTLLLNKLKSLTKSSLNGLNKADARDRFKTYKAELEEVANYDKVVIAYLATYFDVLAQNIHVNVDTHEVVRLTKQSLNELELKYDNIDFNEIVEDYPVKDFEELLNYFETLLPTIGQD